MIQITSPAFNDHEIIPKEYTCDRGSEEVASYPTLHITNVPENARSLAVIMEDPDAPGGTFTHWIIWNLSKDTREIETGIVPEGAVEGFNSAGRIGYLAPCPPSGTHRYFFKVFALKNKLDLPIDSDRTALEAQVKDHVLDEGELVGLYKREL